MLDNQTHQGPLFALLGRIFISELDSDCIATLGQPDICNVFETLQPGYRDFISKEWTPEALEELDADYCSLFILPHKKGLSLKASHWWKEPNAKDPGLEQLINKFVEPTFFENIDPSLPRDHLGILLYFISHVYSSDESDDHRVAANLAYTVLYPWIVDFVDRLLEVTENPLYSAAAQLLLELSRIPQTQ